MNGVAQRYAPWAHHFGLAGEWCLYVAVVTLVFRLGGVQAVGIALLAYSIPSVLIHKRDAVLAWSGVAAVAGLASIAGSTDSHWAIAGLMIVAGTGNALSGRHNAWLAGRTGSPRLAGTLGAAAAVGMIVGGPGIRGALWLTVILLALSSVGPPRDPIVMTGAAGGAAAWGMSIILGMRVVEPGMLLDQRSAIFFIPVWAGAVALGVRARPSDMRIGLAAPFLAAGALAGLGLVEGPALIFLYAAVGLACGLVFGDDPEQEGSLGRRTLAMTVGVGSLSSAVVVLLLSFGFELMMWSMASVLIVAGFAGTYAARRSLARAPVPEPPPAVVEVLLESPLPQHRLADALRAGPAAPLPRFTFIKPAGDSHTAELVTSAETMMRPESVRDAETVQRAEAVPPEESLRDAEIARTLLDALRQARTIRTAAIERYLASAPTAGSSVHARRAAAALDDLLVSARSIKASLIQELAAENVDLGDAN